MKTIVLLGALALAACASAPANPTWQADIAPILASNCVRCHGAPASFGAPPTFRLDIYPDTLDPFTGRKVYGAGTMALNMGDRASAGTMPPVFPLVGADADTLYNFGHLYTPAQMMITPTGVIGVPAQPPPRGDARAGNHAPTFTVLAGPSADGTLTYQIDDLDGDLVHGTLHLADDPDPSHVVVRDLHTGRDTVTIDLAALPDGDHGLTAVLDDGAGDLAVPAGGVHVANPGGATPTIVFVAPKQGDLVRDTPVDVQLAIDDADAADVLSVTLAARDALHPDQATIPITVPAGDRRGATTVTWTPGAIADGLWILEATASDGHGHTRAVRSSRFRVSHATTTVKFADVQPIFDDKCSLCHNECSAIPNMVHDWRSYGTPSPLGACRLTTDGVGDNVGLIYERVVMREDMPPAGQPPLTADERAAIGSYLLGGAPPP